VANFAVIVPAAGKSTRFMGRDKKPFAPLDGRPIWLRAIEHFVARPDVQQVIIVIAPDDREKFFERYGPNLAFMSIEVVDGGSERFESVANALAKVRDEIDFIAVHDAVRPNVPSTLVDAVFAAAIKHGAALPAIPVTDTVKQVDADNKVTKTVPRDGLWLAQTPQVFRRDWLVKAYQKRGTLQQTITDDAQLIEAMGHPVMIVPGVATNFKITTQADLAFAEALMNSMRGTKQTERSSHPFADEEY